VEEEVEIITEEDENVGDKVKQASEKEN